LYDDRDYGGAMGEYRYDLTQVGRSRSPDDRTGDIVEHEDIITMHARRAPSAWETGYYGIGGIDSHVFGKPGEGVHLSVEGNALSGLDFFAPPEEEWVSGAQRFDLGTLAVGASVEMDMLLSIQTSSEVLFPAPRIEIVRLAVENNLLRIRFKASSEAPLDFMLLKSDELAPLFSLEWEWLFVEWTEDPADPEIKIFDVPFSPESPVMFFAIYPILEWD
jgi:hypothetical protein